MKVSELREKIVLLRDMIHEEVDHNSSNAAYYAYLTHSYLFLTELKLKPKLKKGAGRSWVELVSKNKDIYVVDLTFDNPVVKKQETFLKDIDGTEFSLDELTVDWPNNVGVMQTKRWTRYMKQHDTYSHPPNMSQKPKKPRRPSLQAPTVRKHKTL